MRDDVFASAILRTPIMGTSYSGTISLELVKRPSVHADYEWFAGKNYTGVSGPSLDSACVHAAEQWGDNIEITLRESI